jgi:hypothetical protein
VHCALSTNGRRYACFINLRTKELASKGERKENEQYKALLTRTPVTSLQIFNNTRCFAAYVKRRGTELISYKWVCCKAFKSSNLLPRYYNLMRAIEHNYVQ